jgi:hypothetical protein
MPIDLIISFSFLKPFGSSNPDEKRNKSAAVSSTSKDGGANKYEYDKS